MDAAAAFEQRRVVCASEAAHKIADATAREGRVGVAIDQPGHSDQPVGVDDLLDRDVVDLGSDADHRAAPQHDCDVLMHPGAVPQA